MIKRLTLWLSVTLLVFGCLFSAFFPYREFLATSTWRYFHNEHLATFLDGTSPVLAFTIGEYYFNHGSYDIAKAEYYYTRAIEFDTQYLEAYYQRGRIFFIRGKFSLALADIRTVLAIDPEFEKAYYMYGLINGYTGNLPQAEYGFQEFIKRDDFNWAGYNDLAWVYFKQGEFEKTRDTAAIGLTKDPNNPWLNNIYGTALMNLGQKTEAKTAFTLALKESEAMTPERWGKAYPGNNPSIYAAGLEETRAVIRHNLAIVTE